MINRNIIILFVVCVGSAAMTFSVRSVKFWIYSCKVLSGHCFLCRSLAVCTSVANGQYTSSHLCLMSWQLRSLPILFNTGYLSVASSYSCLFVSTGTFSICSSQSAKSMFFPLYIRMYLMRLSCSCHLVIFLIMSNNCFVGSFVHSIML